MTPPHAACTVVIPCFDAEPYLEKAVASVMAQTYRDFHLVLVDDASRDNTRDLARRLAAANRDRITVVELPENKGRSFARNRGTEETRGPYVCFLDQDDSCHPEFLRITTRLLAKHPHLDAIKVHPNLNIQVDPVRLAAIVDSLAITMLISRGPFEFVGGWPEGMAYRLHPGGCEDVAFQELFTTLFTSGMIEAKLYNHNFRPGNAMDRFLSLSKVVDGKLVFGGEPDEFDRNVDIEGQRLDSLLRERTRLFIKERLQFDDASHHRGRCVGFARLGEDSEISNSARTRQAQAGFGRDLAMESIAAAKKLAQSTTSIWRRRRDSNPPRPRAPNARAEGNDPLKAPRIPRFGHGFGHAMRH